MRIFITGGAGFIGCNSAAHFLSQGHEVTLYDNLSRIGGQANLDWLATLPGHENLHFVKGDIRDFAALSAAIPGSDVVLHLASQVAVTLSVQNPREDFEINALGTFNVVEAVRLYCPQATVIYASTNKVYGGLEHLRIHETEKRYIYAELPEGVSEECALDFHSPYGCSKGAGDQYMLDYARIYGLKTLVMRQSCIYGPRQFGVEDQGWVAHFVIAAAQGRPITIFGDGKQVRDLLHVHDLIRAYESGIQHINKVAGQAFNIGGGPTNTLSIWTEFGPLLTELKGASIPVNWQAWRPGDQRVFISNNDKARRLLGWEPEIAPTQGIAQLYEWVTSNPHLFP